MSDDSYFADVFAHLDGIRANTERHTQNSNQEHQEKRSIADNSVTKSNQLARAYYRYNIVEKRIMEALVSRLHPTHTDNEFQDIELTAMDYAQAFSVSPKVAYRDLEKGVSGLMHRIISVEGLGIKGRLDETLMITAHYQKDLGRIICTFNPRIVPHLVGLKEKFRSYPLKEAVSFQSSYTWRMYELLLSWSKPKSQTGGLLAGWLQIEVEEIRKVLGVPKSYGWAMFEKTALNVVTKELREKAHIYLHIERIKTSRKITHLNIKFIQRKPENTGGTEEEQHEMQL